MICQFRHLRVHQILLWGWILCLCIAEQMGFLHFALVDHAIVQADQGHLEYIHKNHRETHRGVDVHFCTDRNEPDQHDHCAADLIPLAILSIQVPNLSGFPLLKSKERVSGDSSVFLTENRLAYAPKQGPPSVHI